MECEPTSVHAAVVDVDATLPDRPTSATPSSTINTPVKREPGTGETGGHNPNQNQARIEVKREPMATDIMNQQPVSSSPKLLPSFAFPPLALPSSPSTPSVPPPLSVLAPSLFPQPPTSSATAAPPSSSSTTTTTTTTTSSSPSPSSSSSSHPPLPLSPTVPSSAMQSRLAPTPSVPLTAPPSSWEQQTLARLNSLTQMTSQIASIALEKTAAKPEASVVEEAGKPDSVVEWVTSISRSLQTELQSVYLTLHSGPAEPSSLPPPVLPASAPTPAPTPALLLGPSPSSPSASPLSLSPSLPSFPPNLHLSLPPEMAPTQVLMASTTSSSPTTLPNSADDANESKKGRRRRKTKPKDSFNHMQRKCASCQRTETTKWRHGPLGSNTLCNTCGLAYSRKKKREAEQAAKLSAAAATPASTPAP